MRSAFLGSLAFLAVLASPLAARAEGPAAPPPDMVKLRDGSMFRGTISELVANDHVDILTSSGQARHFAMKDVEYAGPAQGAPGQVAPPALPAPAAPPAVAPAQPAVSPLVTTQGPRAELAVEADDTHTTFHIKTGQAELEGSGMSWGGHAWGYRAQAKSYEIICTAPCKAGLPVGTHQLGLSRGGSVAESDEPTTISGPGTLHGTYISKTGTRVAGWVIVIGSVVGGTVLMLDSLKKTPNCDSYGFCYDDVHLDGTELGIGVGVALVGGIVGAILAVQKDGADITFVPGTPTASLGLTRREAQVAPTPTFDPRGGAIHVRF